MDASRTSSSGVLAAPPVLPGTAAVAGECTCGDPGVAGAVAREGAPAAAAAGVALEKTDDDGAAVGATNDNVADDDDDNDDDDGAAAAAAAVGTVAGRLDVGVGVPRGEPEDGDSVPPAVARTGTGADAMAGGRGEKSESKRRGGGQVGEYDCGHARRGAQRSAGSGGEQGLLEAVGAAAR
jgi:hypothetical protein